MQKYYYIIISQDENRRLDQFLAKQKDLQLTRSQIVKLINNGQITVNHTTPKPAYKLKISDQVEVIIPPAKALETIPEKIPLNIVYEDDDLIVINKSRGTVVHPAAGNYSGTLVNALLHHCKNLSGIGGVLRPGIVHRLDKDTSGLMVVAKNDFAHQSLTQQFKGRKIFKQYVALVRGELKQENGTIDMPIGRHPVQRKKMAVIKASTDNIKSRQAVTHYRVLKRYKDCTLVEIKLETGRTHQIRVHFQYLGHPLVGDPIYGGRDKRNLPLQLHAQNLGFTHPRTGKYMEFSADLPEDMKMVVK